MQYFIWSCYASGKKYYEFIGMEFKLFLRRENKKKIEKII